LSNENLNLPECTKFVITSGNYDEILKVSEASNNIRGRKEILLLSESTSILQNISYFHNKFNITNDILVENPKKSKKINVYIFISFVMIHLHLQILLYKNNTVLKNGPTRVNFWYYTRNGRLLVG
jgi:hypothetical protein